MTTFWLGLVTTSAVQLPLKYASHIRMADSEQLLELAVVQMEETETALLAAMTFRTGWMQLWISGALLRAVRKDEQPGLIFDGMLGD